MASADATQTASSGALLVRWQGVITPDQAVLKRLEGLAGLLLLALFTESSFLHTHRPGPGDCSLRRSLAALVPLQSATSAHRNHLALADAFSGHRDCGHGVFSSSNRRQQRPDQTAQLPGRLCLALQAAAEQQPMVEPADRRTAEWRPASAVFWLCDSCMPPARHWRAGPIRIPSVPAPFGSMAPWETPTSWRVTCCR